MMSWKSLSNLTIGSKDRHPTTDHGNSSQQSWQSSPVSSPSSRSLARGSSSVSGSKVITDQSNSSICRKLSPADEVVSCLNKKSTDELIKLATDKDAYKHFFNSLEQVKIQNKVHDELQNETLQLARENLEKGPRLLELRNQCAIIRTSELAHTREKLNELERQKDNILRAGSLSSLLQKLQDSVDRIEEESEVLHRKLLDKEIDMAVFLPNYKKLRILHHRKSLLHLAAQTSV